MTTFVLVPGAWIGGWAWRDTARSLRDAGHDAYPVTLTGLGERVHLGSADVDLDTHIADVRNLMEYEDLVDVALVGHSYAGIVIHGVADRIPERIGSLIYLDTGPLPDGLAHLDFSPPEEQAKTAEVVQKHGDGWRLPFPGVDGLGAPSATKDFDDRVRHLLSQRAVAQPYGSYRQPLRLERDFDGEYERVAILAGGFGLPVEQLREMIARGDGPFAAMTGPDWRFLELDTGHWPMLTAPDLLARTLELAAAGSSRAGAGGRG